MDAIADGTDIEGSRRDPIPHVRTENCEAEVERIYNVLEVIGKYAHSHLGALLAL